jgi:alanyl-tRNA synthetase
MGVPGDRMVVSIYQGDDEAERIWKDVVGLSDDRIFRFGEDENFWPPNARTEGPNGPCGPCSEIFYDFGEGTGCGRPECDPSCSCGRYVEVYNLVFQQYDRKEDATLDPLPMQNIDTGLGLERLARILQGVETNFETDHLMPIVRRIADLCGRTDGAGAEDMRWIRRIADHARAVVFCVADGVIPSNEERGYVVRRLLRRAAEAGLHLGMGEPFLVELIDPIIESHADPYPELAESRGHIATIIGEEERTFHRTLSKADDLLARPLADMRRGRRTELEASVVFDLYQTHGIPPSVTAAAMEQQGMTVDMAGFMRLMESHQETSRRGAAFTDEMFVTGPLARLQEGHEPTEFTGYTTLESSATVIGIIDDDELVESAAANAEVAVVLDRTPAYGEAGGQVGDQGVIAGEGGGARFEFHGVRREKGFFLHAGSVAEGSLKVGDHVTCSVDRRIRMATQRNHTATHLLHWALRKVLGEHAKQAGSHVSAERLRFDFANPTELGADRLRQIEDLVNERVLADEPVTWARMGLSEARELGAMALFGETYGDVVRVISVGDFSRELCGGTHCERTGQIGLLRITHESSVAGGVRRIEAVTGTGVLERLRAREEQIGRLSGLMHTPEDGLIRRAEDLLGEIRSLQKQLDEQKQQAARSMASGSLVDRAEKVGNARLVLAKMDGGPAELRSAADVLRRENDGLACVLASTGDGKVAIVVGVADDLVSAGLSAKELARAAADIVGGGGGGRDDLAQAGGPDVVKLDEAFGKVRQMVEETLPS